MKPGCCSNYLTKIFLIIIGIQLYSAKYSCGPESEIGKSYQIGDSMPLCLIFPQISGNKNKLAFKVDVDKFTSLYADKVYQKVNSSKGNVVLVAPGTDFYIQSSYISSDKVINIMSAIVHLSGGKISKVQFDLGCHYCTTDYCIESTIVKPDATQTSELCSIDKCIGISSNQSSDCDLQIYVSFRGTDSSGNELTSDNKRISNFRKYSIYDLYRSAKKQFQ